MTEARYYVQGVVVCVVTDVAEAVSLFGLDHYGFLVTPAMGMARRTRETNLDLGRSGDHFRLVYRDRRRVSLRWDGQGEMIFEAPWGLIRPSPALEVLGNLAVRRALQERGRFVLHASAISRTGRAVVLFGGAGAGKTTLALTLCLRHGFRLLSNDSALLELDESERPVVCGTLKAGLTLRYSSFSRSFPVEAERLFAGVAGQSAAFDAKRTLSSAKLGLEEESRPQTLVALYHLRLLPGSVRTGALEPVHLRLGVYESLALHVRGTAAFIGFGEGHRKSVHVPCLDSPKLHEGRRRLIEALITHARTEYLAGPPLGCAARVASAVAHRSDHGEGSRPG